MALRRSSESVTPVGFWKLGMMYISLGLYFLIFSSTSSGMTPFSSVATGMMRAL